MNVYDFDKTIYARDSSISIYLYVIKRKPIIMIKSTIRQLIAFISYRAGKIGKERLKSEYFSFLKNINIDEYIPGFIDQEMANIEQWYINRKRKDDIWITASPYFIVAKFAEKLGISNVIGSNIEKGTGEMIGKNCFGDEKRRRIEEIINSNNIDEFYSDSLSDYPMAKLAKKAFWVDNRKHKIRKWPEA